MIWNGLRRLFSGFSGVAWEGLSGYVGDGQSGDSGAATSRPITCCMECGNRLVVDSNGQPMQCPEHGRLVVWVMGKGRWDGEFVIVIRHCSIRRGRLIVWGVSGRQRVIRRRRVLPMAMDHRNSRVVPRI